MAKATETAGQTSITDPVVNEKTHTGEEQPKIPAQKTLPELMADSVKLCMENPKLLPQAYRDLDMWYNAQPLEGRKELIPQIKKQIEAGKLTLEALYGQFQMISSRDL